MANVLPYVPSFVEQLFGALQPASQAVGSLIGGYMGDKSRLARQGQQASEAEAVFNDPNASPYQKALAFSKLPETLKKSSGPIFAAALGPEAEMAAWKGFMPNAGPGKSDIKPPPPPSSPPPAAEGAAPQKIGAPLEIGGYEFEASEVPEVPSRLPAIGPFKSEANLQAQEMSTAKKEASEYVAPFRERASEAKVNAARLQRARQLVKTGKAGINPQNVLAASTAVALKGEKGEKFSQLLKTTEAKELDTIFTDNLKAVKDFGGSRPTQAEVFIQRAALPNYLDSEADMTAKIDYLDAMNEYNEKKANLTVALHKHNPYMSPTDIDRLVASKMEAPLMAILKKGGMVPVYKDGVFAGTVAPDQVNELPPGFTTK